MKELRPEIHLIQGKVEKGMNFGKHEHMKTIIHGKERTEVSETEVVVDISSLKLKGNDKEREFQFPFCYQKKPTKQKNHNNNQPNKTRKKKEKRGPGLQEKPFDYFPSCKIRSEKKKKKKPVQMFGEKLLSYQSWGSFPFPPAGWQNLLEASW